MKLCGVERRYLADIIYGVFVKGKKLPMVTFLTEEEAEVHRHHLRDYRQEQIEIVPLSEVLRFTPEMIAAMGN
jgi:hypothetical protein